MLPETKKNYLDKLQATALNIIFNRKLSYNELLELSGLEDLRSRRRGMVEEKYACTDRLYNSQIYTYSRRRQNGIYTPAK